MGRRWCGTLFVDVECYRTEKCIARPERTLILRPSVRYKRQSVRYVRTLHATVTRHRAGRGASARSIQRLRATRRAVESRAHRGRKRLAHRARDGRCPARPVGVTSSRFPACRRIEKKRENKPKTCVRACKDNPEMTIVHLTHDPFSFRISGPLAYTHARRFFGSPTFLCFSRKPGEKPFISYTPEPRR